jgi:hypothetical protein
MKAYLISFWREDIFEDALASYLDTRPEVLNWLILMPNTLGIVATRNAKFITRLLEKQFPDSFFIVVEYNPHNSDGLLSEDAWEFLNNPEAA